MIKSIKDLTDKELEIQCTKHNIDCEDNRRANKLRSLASKGLHKVYVPGPSKEYSRSQVHHETQTIFKNVHNVVFANISEPSTSTIICEDENEHMKKQLTTNIVVTDAVYSHLAVQEDLHVNGSIISRGQVLNPKPVCIKVLQNEASISLDLKSNHYTFKIADPYVHHFAINVEPLESVAIGHKGIMFFVNETENNNVQVHFSNKFAMSLIHTIPADTKRFSFEFFVDVQNSQRFVSVQFIEFIGEAHGHVFSNVLLRTLSDVPDNNDASGNSYLMSRDNELYWKNLNYIKVFPDGEGKIILNNNYANFQIDVISDIEISGFDDTSQAIGLNGHIAIKNIGSNEVNFSNIWKFSASTKIERGELMTIEYIVLKNDVIVGKFINHTHQITHYNSTQKDEIIIHVTVSNGKFELKDVHGSPIQSLIRGKTYVFVYQDNSFNNHPLRFSDTNDGFWNT